MKIVCKKCDAQLYIGEGDYFNNCPECGNVLNHLEFDEDELWQKDFSKEQARAFIRNNCQEIVIDEGRTKVILEFATGVGKSINAIQLQNQLACDWDFHNTVIFVPEVSHIKNWADEYKKHGYDDLLKDTRILCYNSIEKASIKGDIDILILDEVHHMNTELRIAAFEKLHPIAVIGLSATLSDDDKKAFNKTFIKNDELFTYKITLSQAIAMNLVPKPRIKIIEIELDDKDASYIVDVVRGDASKAEEITCSYLQRGVYLNNVQKYGNIKLRIMCTQKQRYDYLQREYYVIKNMANKYNNEVFWNKLRRKGLERKIFMSNIKTNHVKKLTTALTGNSKFVCFCGSIIQAEYLGKNNSIHSKRKDNQDLINRFNAGYINSLYAVGMLQEGNNLNGIESAIIVQLDGDERPFIQKTGRALRAEYPTVYLFKAIGTKDEELFDNVLANVPKEYIEYVQL